MALLDRATNLFGPLDDDIKRRIMAFIEKPSEPGWEDIFSIIINERARLTGVRTIWQAVRVIDPTFPNMKRGKKWQRIPDPMTVARAIKAATAETGVR